MKGLGLTIQSINKISLYLSYEYLAKIVYYTSIDLNIHYQQNSDIVQSNLINNERRF